MRAESVGQSGGLSSAVAFILVCTAMGCPPFEYPAANLSVSANIVVIDADSASATFSVANNGIRAVSLPFTITAAEPWLRLNPASGVIPAFGAPAAITLTVDRTLVLPGVNESTITVSSASQTAGIHVIVESWIPVLDTQGGSGCFGHRGAFAQPHATPAVLETFLALDEGADLAALDAILEELFPPESPPPAPEIFVLEILRYISEIMRPDPALTALDDPALQRAGFLHGAAIAETFAALCRRSGLPARALTLWNASTRMPHTGAEVYYEEAWHFFEPMLAMFYYTAPEFGANGEIPSLTTIRVGAPSSQYAFILDPAKPAKATPRRLLEDEALPEAYAFLSGAPAPAYFDTVTRAAAPVSVIGEATTTIFPITFDFNNGSEARVGVLDGDPADLFAPHAAPLLGETPFFGAAHLLCFKNATPGLYQITYYFVDRDVQHAPAAAEVDSVAIGALAFLPGKARIEARVLGPGALLLVDLFEDESAPSALKAQEVDAIHIKRISSESSREILGRRRAGPAAWAPDKAGTWEIVDLSERPNFSLEGAFCHGLMGTEEEALRLYLHFNQEYDVSILDDALIDIFGATAPEMPPEQIALEILSYVTQIMPISDSETLKLNESPTHTGSYRLDKGWGNCYERALAFVSLCRRAGLPARANNIAYGYHAAAEVFHGGAWHYYDPTSGFFFYDRSSYDGAGRVLSMADLRYRGAQDASLFLVTTAPWTGLYDGQVTVAAAPPDYALPNNWPTYAPGGPLVPWYKDLFVASFPTGTPYFADKTQFVPLELDFSLHNALTLGEVNQSEQDSLSVLGPTAHSNSIHLLRFRNADPGAYRISYQFLFPNYPYYPGVVEAKGIRLLDSRRTLDGRWYADCLVEDREAIAMLDLVYNSDIRRRGTWAAVDAIHVERIGDIGFGG